MTTFAIIAPASSPQIDMVRAAVERVFPDSFLEFSPGQFVAVAPEMTSEEAAKKLGPSGAIGQFVVFTVAGRWGYHRKDLWEWLTAKGG